MMFLSEYEYQALILSLKSCWVCYLMAYSHRHRFSVAACKETVCWQKHSREHCAPAFGAASRGHRLFVAGDERVDKALLAHGLPTCLVLYLAPSWKGAALACVVVALPLMVRSIRLSLETVDSKSWKRPLPHWAPPIRVFFTITLPLMIPDHYRHYVFSFARSLGWV